MSKLRFVLSLVAMILLFIEPASAVCDTTVPTNYPTIQQAISNASSGQTVCVNTGTYIESDLTFQNSSISLVANGTVLISNDHTPVIYINKSYINITGFNISITTTIIDSNIDFEGVVEIYSGNNANISNNTINQFGIYSHSNPENFGMMPAINIQYANNVIVKNNYLNTQNWKSSGIYIRSSQYSNISNNSIKSRMYYSIYVDDTATTTYYNHTVDTSNTGINGKSIYYYYNANNVVLDGVSTDQIFVANTNNFTLKNITMDNGDGVTFVHVTYSNISNYTNTKSAVSSLLSNGYGEYKAGVVYEIYLYYSDYNIIDDIDFHVAGRHNLGIFYIDADYNIVTNYTFSKNDLFLCCNVDGHNEAIEIGRGSGASTPSSFNIIKNGKFTHSQTDYSMVIYTADNLYLENITMSSVDPATVQIFNSDNVYVKNTTILNGNSFWAQKSINNLTVIDSNLAFVSSWKDFLNGDMYLINTTGSISVSDGTVYRQWYLDLTVKNTTTWLSDALVNGTNNSGGLVFSLLSDSNGNATRQTLTQYKETSSGKNYIGYANYTVNTSKTGYQTDSRQYNLSTSTSNVIWLALNGEDIIAPTHSNAGHNQNYAGLSTVFSILVNDSIALQGNGTYIFATNNSGVWINDTAINFTTTPQWSNVTKTLNSTVGKVIGYRWYIKDNAGNYGNTSIYTLMTTYNGFVTNGALGWQNTTIVGMINNPCTNQIEFNRYRQESIYAYYSGDCGKNWNRTSGVDFTGTYVLGKYGNAYSLNEATSHTINKVLTGNMSIMAWVTYTGTFGTSWPQVVGGYINATNFFKIGIDKNHNYELNFQEGGVSALSYNYEQLPTTFSHIGGTFSGTDMYRYLDGSQSGATTAPLGSKEMTYIGYDGVASHYWLGLIDEVFIYNVYLTSTEVGYVKNNIGKSINGTMNITFAGNTSGIVVTAIIPTNTNYTVVVRDNTTDALIQEWTTPQIVNATFTLSSLANNTKTIINWYGNGSATVQVMEIQLLPETDIDTIAPTYSNANYSNNYTGEQVNFTINYDDETVLHPNGQWMFSTNNTGEWINSSWINFTNTPETTMNGTVLNSTIGKVVGYRWYAKDNAGNYGNTSIYTLMTMLETPSQNRDNDISLFWVRTNGNNSCNGQNNMDYGSGDNQNLTDCAWLTVTKAGSSLIGGQIVRVQAGEYLEQSITISNSSTIFIADGNVHLNQSITTTGKTNGRIDGFNLTGTQIYLGDNSHGWTIINNTISAYLGGYGGISTRWSDDLIIRNNTIKSISWYGLYINHGNNITIRNNIVGDNGLIADNMDYAYKFDYLTNSVSSGNIGYSTTHNWRLRHSVTNNTFINESSYNNDNYAFELDDDASRNTFENFTIDGNNPSYPALSGIAHDGIAIYASSNNNIFNGGVIKNITEPSGSRRGIVVVATADTSPSGTYDETYKSVGNIFKNISIDNVKYGVSFKSPDNTAMNITITNASTAEYLLDIGSNETIIDSANTIYRVKVMSASNLLVNYTNNKIFKWKYDSIGTWTSIIGTVTINSPIGDITFSTEGYSISGYVNDTLGSAISSVSVVNGTNSTTTNATGYYNLIMSNGTYNFSYSKSRYITNYKEITINGADVTNQNVTLQFDNNIPPSPINLTNTTGNFWINHTWQAGSGNITNSYNVSQNGTLTNGSTNIFKNVTVGAHGWSNISVYAYNNSGNGLLNQTPVSQNTQVPNNAPVQSAIGNKQVTAGQWLNFTVSVTDADSDNIIYGTNASKGNINTLLASDNIKYSNNTEYWMNSSAEMKLTSNLSGLSSGYGSFRITYRDYTLSGDTFTQIYKNNISYGTLHYHPAADPDTVDYTEDFYGQINASDIISVYANNSLVGFGSISLFRLKYDNISSFNWSTTEADVGTYYWNFNSSDAYGGVDDETITVTVNDVASPNITSWSNNYTSNQNLSFIINIFSFVNFNVTANQTITTWNWYKDDVNQNNNLDNITLSWSSSGTKTVKVNATNSNGTSNTIQWNVTVNIPTPTNLANDTPTSSSVNINWTSVTGAVAYQVFKNETSLGTTTNTYYNVTGLSASTEYNFTVRANDSANNWGANSTNLTVNTIAETVTADTSSSSGSSGSDSKWHRTGIPTPSAKTIYSLNIQYNETYIPTITKYKTKQPILLGVYSIITAPDCSNPITIERKSHNIIITTTCSFSYISIDFIVSNQFYDVYQLINGVSTLIPQKLSGVSLDDDFYVITATPSSMGNFILVERTDANSFVQLRINEVLDTINILTATIIDSLEPYIPINEYISESSNLMRTFINTINSYLPL